MFVMRPFIFTLKFLAYRFTTVHGPSYGGVSAGFTLSFRMKTWVQVHRFSLTNGFSLWWLVPGVGRSAVIVFLSSFTKSVADWVFDSVRNSPGMRRVVPNTSSAGVAPISGLMVQRRPSRMIGNLADQFSGSVATMAALRVRCRRSIIPLACAWYRDERKWSIPRRRLNSEKRQLSNCRPWSVVTCVGIPNVEIQCAMSADATVVAVMSMIGMAVGHRVTRSITVRQYQVRQYQVAEDGEFAALQHITEVVDALKNCRQFAIVC